MADTDENGGGRIGHRRDRHFTAALGPFAPAAHAGGCTAYVFCSNTINSSSWGATAIKNWTCSGNSTGDWSTGCVDLSTTMYLPPGSSTPAFEDWDAFRVDTGWCYRVLFETYTSTWTRLYYASHSPIYVKVSNDAIANIEAQYPSSCP